MDTHTEQIKVLTLMEVIIVMVIIIILTTILMPAFIKGRELGKNIACKSNIKTLSESILAYAGAFKGYAPPAGSNTNAAWSWVLQDTDYIPKIKVGLGNNVTMPVFMNPSTGFANQWCYYPINYKNILACPSENMGVVNSYAGEQLGRSRTTLLSTVEFRWIAGSHYGQWYGINRYGHIPMIAWKNSTGRPMIADTFGTSGTFYGGMRMIYGRHFGRTKNMQSAYNNPDIYSYTGNAKSNFIMLDGHSESFTDEQTYTLKMRNGGWTIWDMYHPL